MRVSQPGSNPVQGGESKQTGRASQGHEAKRTDRSSSNEVEKKSRPDASTEISKKSKELAKAKTAASEAPDVREGRVADIKKRIEEGTYKVDADAIADRLVDDHISMPGIG